MIKHSIFFIRCNFTVEVGVHLSFTLIISQRLFVHVMFTISLNSQLEQLPPRERFYSDNVTFIYLICWIFFVKKKILLFLKLLSSPHTDIPFFFRLIYIFEVKSYIFVINIQFFKHIIIYI